jgi:hypothetical protein
MPIPLKLENELEQALDIVIWHPTHEYGPKQRRKLFDIFKSDPFSMKVWRWLAVITARHVLPIYEAHVSELNQADWYYDLKFPSHCLEVAEKVLLGEREAQVGYDMANGAYDPSDFDYVTWRVLRPVPFKIYQASWAASIALLEVSKDDNDPFQHLSNTAYANNCFFEGVGVANEIRNSYPDGIPGEEFTDSLWAQSGHSDIAAVASTAWACEGLSRKTDPQRLSEFWHWWITEAISQAWKLAEEHAS